MGDYIWPLDGTEKTFNCAYCHEKVYWRETKKGHQVAIDFKKRVLHRLICESQKNKRTGPKQERVVSFKKKGN